MPERMIIICSTVPPILTELVELIGQLESRTGVCKNVVYTGAPELVEPIVGGNLRYGIDTIVISSNVFHGGAEDTTIHGGVQLAERIKRINPETWFFIYSTAPESSPYVDGIIPKGDGPPTLGGPYGDHLRYVVEFMRIDFELIDTLELLHAKLPWLKP